MSRAVVALPAVLFFGIFAGPAVAFWVAMAFGVSPEESMSVCRSLTWSPARDLFVNILIDALLLVYAFCIVVCIIAVGLVLAVFAVGMLLVAGVASISPIASYVVAAGLLFFGVRFTLSIIRSVRRRKRRKK